MFQFFVSVALLKAARIRLGVSLQANLVCSKRRPPYEHPEDLELSSVLGLSDEISFRVAKALSPVAHSSSNSSTHLHRILILPHQQNGASSFTLTNGSPTLVKYGKRLSRKPFASLDRTKASANFLYR